MEPENNGQTEAESSTATAELPDSQPGQAEQTDSMAEQSPDSPTETTESSTDSEPEKSTLDILNGLERKVEDEISDSPTEEQPSEEASKEDAAKKDSADTKQEGAETDTDLDLEPEQNWNDKTKQRWEKLTTNFKELRADYDQQTERLQAMDEVIASTGCDGRELSELFEYASLVKSGDPNNMQAALEILDNQRRDLMLALGVPDREFDVLSAHPDLRDEVDEGMLSQDRALEIARQRDTQSRTSALNQAQEQQTRQNAQAAEQWNNYVSDLKTQVRAMEDQWMKTDPQAKEKIAKLAEGMAEIMQKHPPELWTRAIQLEYKGLSLIPASNPKPKTSGPIKPGITSGGIPTGKQSTLDILDRRVVGNR